MTAKNTWRSMIERCFNPKCNRYNRYGARGITVCERWLSFQAFFDDMGERPEGMSLNRINNDGNYEPSNCEWATPQQQAQNRSDNYTVTFNGETLCVTEWARRMNIPREALRNRLYRGWKVEDALTRPLQMKNMNRTTPNNPDAVGGDVNNSTEVK